MKSVNMCMMKQWFGTSMAHKRNISGLIHKPKLNWSKVSKIRSEYLYASRTCNLRTLAQCYGVSRNTIHKVVTNRTWKCPEYEARMVNHPITAKRQFNAYLKASIRAKNMYDSFRAARSDPDMWIQFLKDYGR